VQLAVEETKTGVALSSTEAEFVLASELGKNIKFLRSLIDEVNGGQAILPSHISEDNTGAIFLMKNNGIRSMTKARRHSDAFPQ
jgi:hypothetical protein